MIIKVGDKVELNNGEVGIIKRSGNNFEVIKGESYILCRIDKNGNCLDIHEKQITHKYSVKRIIYSYTTCYKDTETGKVYDSLEEMEKDRKKTEVEKELDEILNTEIVKNLSDFVWLLNRVKKSPMKKEIMEYINDRVES